MRSATIRGRRYVIEERPNALWLRYRVAARWGDRKGGYYFRCHHRTLAKAQRCLAREKLRAEGEAWRPVAE